jgi:hypothetical protein
MGTSAGDYRSNDEGFLHRRALENVQAFSWYYRGMPSGAVKLENDKTWHAMSYAVESQFLIYIVSPPEAISYVYGATVDVRFADNSIRTGQGGRDGRVSFTK